MRRLSVLFPVVVGCVILFFSGASVMAGEGVEVGIGSLKIGGNYQGYYAWYDNDDAASEFDTKRARLLLFGTLIPDKIDYFVQAEAVSSPYLLDSKLILKYIPNTAISMGRFVPNYTLYMPKSTARLNLINYPLTTLKTAMWRQTGVQSTTTTEFFDVTLGIFNGYQTDAGSESLKGNDWGDNNDAKDFLIQTNIKPMKGLNIGLFGWFGSAYNVDADEDFDTNRYGANFEYTGTHLYLAGEYLMGTTESISSSDVDCSGFFGHIGYNINDSWELHVRYDDWDPNTDVDDNGESWFTGGINFKLLNYNAMFYLNYIARREDGTDIDNDEFVLMFQYAF
ncbi:hypothetical protein JXA80_02125 [bacterium]|nr:hypothetical protein [candidate division CSSED10-310 bacterium]